jgi:hypothetical protein
MPMDLRARETVLNFSGANSIFGCATCIIQGQSRDNRIFYPHAGSPFRLRNRQFLDRCVEELKKNPELDSMFGVKGDSVMSSLIAFEYPMGIHTDPMHCIYINIVKYLLGLMFSDEYKGERFSCFHLIETIESRISKIKVPVGRLEAPRRMADLAYWKAVEARAFLMYHWPLVFKGLLSPDQLELWSMLSAATRYLAGPQVEEGVASDADVPSLDFPMTVYRAHGMFLRVVSLVKNIFGENNVLINIHLLEHLAAQVLAYGPLWASSCFPFETAGADLVKGHLTRRQGHALSATIRFFRDAHIAQLVERYVQDNPDDSSFFQALDPARYAKSSEDNWVPLPYEPDSYAVDKPSEIIHKPLLQQLQFISHELCKRKVHAFAQAAVGGRKFLSLAHTRKATSFRFSAAVQIALSPTQCAYGVVRFFLYDELAQRSFAVVRDTGPVGRMDAAPYHLACQKIPYEFASPKTSSDNAKLTALLEQDRLAGALHLVPLSSLMRHVFYYNADSFDQAAVTYWNHDIQNAALAVGLLRWRNLPHAELN